MPSERTKRLGEEKIGKLLARLSIPATIGMLVMALYNVVDTIFVGRGVGTMAIAGLTIVFPIQMLITSLAQTIGIGGASVISRSLGAEDHERANRTFGNLFVLVVLLSAVTTGLSIVFIEPLLKLFGASPKILPFAKDYFSVMIAGIPFISFAMMSNNIIRAEGNAKFAMYTMLLSAAINLILDPIFIFVLDWGIKGAAYASVIAQFSATVYVVVYFLSGKSTLKLFWRNLRLDGQIVGETFAIGVSSFARHMSSSVMAAVLNNSLVVYGGEIAVAIFGIVYRVMAFTLMPILGVVQGFLPIAGYNYGAKNFQRLRDAIRISNITATAIAFAGFLAVMLWSKGIFAIFTKDKELIEQGAQAMRYMMLAFVLIGFQVIGSGLFQALGRAVPALLLSLSRQVLFLIPLVLILPRFFGLPGIWFAFPLSDVLAALITGAMLLYQMQFLRKPAIEK